MKLNDNLRPCDYIEMVKVNGLYLQDQRSYSERRKRSLKRLASFERRLAKHRRNAASIDIEV